MSSSTLPVVVLGEVSVDGIRVRVSTVTIHVDGQDGLVFNGVSGEYYSEDGHFLLNPLWRQRLDGVGFPAATQVERAILEKLSEGLI